MPCNLFFLCRFSFRKQLLCLGGFLGVPFGNRLFFVLDLIYQFLKIHFSGIKSLKLIPVQSFDLKQSFCDHIQFLFVCLKYPFCGFKGRFDNDLDLFINFRRNFLRVILVRCEILA